MERTKTETEKELEKEREKQQRRKKYAEKFGYMETGAEIFPTLNQGEIPSDVLGSYTGTSRDGEIPTQDADDL